MVAGRKPANKEGWGKRKGHLGDGQGAQHQPGWGLRTTLASQFVLEAGEAGAEEDGLERWAGYSPRRRGVRSPSPSPRGRPGPHHHLLPSSLPSSEFSAHPLRGRWISRKRTGPGVQFPKAPSAGRVEDGTQAGCWEARQGVETTASGPAENYQAQKRPCAHFPDPFHFGCV